LSRKDWHSGAIGAVLSVNFGRQGRPEILPRRLHRRGGASVVRRDAAKPNRGSQCQSLQRSNRRRQRQPPFQRQNHRDTVLAILSLRGPIAARSNRSLQTKTQPVSGLEQRWLDRCARRVGSNACGCAADMRITARCAQTSHATPCFQRDHHFGKRGRRRLRLGGHGGHISCTRSPSLIICVNRQATIYEPLLRSGAFSANLLRPEHQALSAAFSGKKAGR
jgi:hypothetical protein